LQQRLQLASRFATFIEYGVIARGRLPIIPS